jgi:hypothetical protein
MGAGGRADRASFRRSSAKAGWASRPGPRREVPACKVATRTAKTGARRGSRSRCRAIRCREFRSPALPLAARSPRAATLPRGLIVAGRGPTEIKGPRRSERSEGQGTAGIATQFYRVFPPSYLRPFWHSSVGVTNGNRRDRLGSRWAEPPPVGHRALFAFKRNGLSSLMAGPTQQGNTQSGRPANRVSMHHRHAGLLISSYLDSCAL